MPPCPALLPLLRAMHFYADPFASAPGKIDSRRLPREIRAVQRRLRGGELKRIAPGAFTNLPEEAWPSLIARERIRMLAATFPKAVIGPRSAFMGGAPREGVMYLTYTPLKWPDWPRS